MREQMIRYTAAGVVGTILIIGLVMMINWLGARHWSRWDATSTKIYSLSPKSLSILAELDEEVHVIVFMTPASPMYREVRELMNRYTAASDLLTVEYIDPDREPLRTSQLAEQFGITMADTVVFTAGERSKYVTSDKLAEMDYSGMSYGEGPRMRAFKGEEQLTSAILSLVAQQVPKVYFVTGHGEIPVAGRGDEASVSLLQEVLKRENMDVAVTTLLGGEVPDDADVLAILSPRQAYTEGEIEVLREYLGRGGRLLLCLDPVIESDGTLRTTRLEALIAELGVHVSDDLVIDPEASLRGWDPATVYVAEYQEHPVTTGLLGVASLFLTARSVEANPGSGWTAQELVQTSDQGWGETDLAALAAGAQLEPDDNDNQGPVSLAVAVEERLEDDTFDDLGGEGDPLEEELRQSETLPGLDDAASGTEAESTPGESGSEDGDAELGETDKVGFRIVVFGDGAFLTDGIIANLGNMTLALNSFNWLAERDQIVGIPPRDLSKTNMYLSASQLGTILLIAVLLMPAGAVVLGIVVWRRRRH